MKKTITLLGLSLFAAACATSYEGQSPEKKAIVDAMIADGVQEKVGRRMRPMPTRGPGQVVAEALPEEWMSLDPENTIYLDLPQGRVVIALTQDLAPGHIEQIKTLLDENYYEGLHFYRVIEGFVAQGGDESGEKPKGSAAETLPAEFDEAWRQELPFTWLDVEDGYADRVGFVNGFPVGRDMRNGKTWLAHCTGAFAFGRENARDSASTEFYITLQPQRYLDRNLTVFGRVVWGMEHVQAITRGKPNNGGVIEDKARWTEITAMKLAKDVPADERLDLQMLNTNSESFADLMLARLNRPEEFFYFRPNHVDLCQLPLPVRLKPSADDAE